jgi:hypothetical protein
LENFLEKNFLRHYNSSVWRPIATPSLGKFGTV